MHIKNDFRLGFITRFLKVSHYTSTQPECRDEITQFTVLDRWTCRKHEFFKKGPATEADTRPKEGT